jgi:hypothetical protein
MNFEQLHGFFHGNQNNLQRLHLLRQNCIYDVIHAIQGTIVFGVLNHLIIDNSKKSKIYILEKK